jgi:uncharacterized integral membrane protein
MTGPSYDDRMPEPGGDPYERTPGEAAGTAPPAATVPPERSGYLDDPAAGTPEAPEKVPARTRVSGIWVASTAAVFVLLILLIFILQNGNRVKINIFGANPTLPLGVALLLAAVLGALLVALIGAARVVQLRHTARKMARRSR